MIAGVQGAMATEEWPFVLSSRQARAICEARAVGAATVAVSLDLGLTVADVALTPERALLPRGLWLGWDDLAAIAEREEACYAVRAPGEVERIGRFSEALRRHYSLFPTTGAPTILIAGFSMHRIKGTDPQRDTLAKVRAAAPLRGRILDTSTGLGYTAIEAARAPTVEEVVTIELDPTTLAIARDNPWSRALFTDPKIRQIIGDSYDVVPEFPPDSFSRIIHDPPIFSLAGELYSGAFYRELFRILRRGWQALPLYRQPRQQGGRGCRARGDPPLKRSGLRAHRAPPRGVRRRGDEGTLTDARAATRPWRSFGTLAMAARWRTLPVYRLRARPSDDETRTPITVQLEAPPAPAPPRTPPAARRRKARAPWTHRLGHALWAPNHAQTTPTARGALRALVPHHLLPLLLYGLLAALATYPLLLHFGTRLPSDGGDALQNYWNYWWTARALSAGQNPYWTPFLYAPYGAPLYLHTLNLFNGIVGLPVQWAFGMVPAYNTVVFLSFILAGYFAYLLVAEVSGSRLAGFVGGVVYAFGSYHMTHLLGHMNLLASEWLPAYLLCLRRAIGATGRRRQATPSWRSARCSC
jgi:predicted methyltransferase